MPITTMLRGLAFVNRLRTMYQSAEAFIDWVTIYGCTILIRDFKFIVFDFHFGYWYD